MKIAWATDIHLNFIDEAKAATLCERIRQTEAEALLLGGDIAEADDLVDWLRFLEAHLEVPIYFVLGNHDFYGSDIATVRQRVSELRSDQLFWLPKRGVVELSPATGLIGHDGWGDARLGDPQGSPVSLSDFFLISDLRECTGSSDPLAVLSDREALTRQLNLLGDECAKVLRISLESAMQSFDNVIVLTHVPPFREACWHEGQISDDDWLPFFTCKAIGDLLMEMARAHPTTRISVLCGHTHGSGEAQLLPNLTVSTGAAAYGSPTFMILDSETQRLGR